MILPFGLLLASLFSPAQISAVPLETKLRLIEVINEDRREVGLPPVKYSPELSRAADEHCREMLREGYTSHWNMAGWKPYLRYAQAGVRDYTAENAGSRWKSFFPADPEGVWDNVLGIHHGFMDEEPPHDGHRRTVLGPNYTHVGIGVAYDDRGMRLIEVFRAGHVEAEPLPLRANLRARLLVRGRVVRPGFEVAAVSVYYERLPQPMTVEQLRATSSYGLPPEETAERRRLSPPTTYTDGSQGSVTLEPGARFSVPLRFWKKQPGVYTAAVWVRRPGGDPFIAALLPVRVEADAK